MIRLVPRLKTMQFQLHFPELVIDCKPDMESAIAACQEVTTLSQYINVNADFSDQKFSEVL